MNLLETSDGLCTTSIQCWGKGGGERGGGWEGERMRGDEEGGVKGSTIYELVNGDIMFNVLRE